MEMIDTSKMPGTYGLCLATETECPKAATCLRSLVFHQQNDKSRKFVNVVNYNNAEIGYATEHCTAYASSQKIRYARGMKHIFDDVKKAEWRAVRMQVMDCFSCESFFYRSQNGTRRITPEEQARIARVFREIGISEPKFDAYAEDYDWR